jgi:RNA polymerase sigma-70 factor (family 1)
VAEPSFSNHAFALAAWPSTPADQHRFTLALGGADDAGERSREQAHHAEARIAASLRTGDWQAFRTVFDAHYHVLLRFATYHTGSRDLADDLVQEVFANLWNTRASLAISSSFRAYLIRAVRNRILNASRHDATVRRTNEHAMARGETLTMGARVPSPETALQELELQQRMTAAIAALPPRQREIMLLRWRDELTPPEIAEAIGIAEQGVRRQLAAAAGKLRVAFTRDDLR